MYTYYTIFVPILNNNESGIKNRTPKYYNLKINNY